MKKTIKLGLIYIGTLLIPCLIFGACLGLTWYYGSFQTMLLYLGFFVGYKGMTSKSLAGFREKIVAEFELYRKAEQKEKQNDNDKN